MRILLARQALSAILLLGVTGVSAGQRTGSNHYFDSIITQRPVMLFHEFEQALEAAANQCGIPANILDRIVREFAQTNTVRVIPYAEWKAFLLDSLYRNEVPYPVAAQFLRQSARTISRSCRAISAGNLGSRYNMSLYGLYEFDYWQLSATVGVWLSYHSETRVSGGEV